VRQSEAQKTADAIAIEETPPMQTAEQRHGIATPIEAAPTHLRRIADLPGPKGIPLLGNMLQIESIRFHQILENWAREFGPFYRMRMGRKQLLVVSDHATIAGFLRDRPEAIRRSSRTANALDELGTCGVFTAEGEEWLKQRKLVMRALTPEVIRHFFPTLSMMTERLLHRWETAVDAGKPVDVLRDLKAFTLDVTIGLAMGQDINTLEHDDNPLQRDIEQLFKQVARRITAPFPYWRRFKLPVDRAADACADRIAHAITGFVAETRKRIDANPELRAKPTNMLEALIVARDEPDSGFNDDHVIGNAVTMVFAGEDTTSNTIAWLLDFVARHPQAAARLREEADAILGESRVLRDFGALDKFVYTDAATNEAMRIKPVAPLMGMETNIDLVVGDIFIPKGTVIMSLLRRAGETGGDFAEPEQFRPERFLDDKEASATNPARKLFPFGGGPRFCPGRYLAIAEIKMVVAMIARNFTLEFDAGAPPVEELFTFTMTPSALPVKLKKRVNH
jgi:cytochrome P450